MELARSCQLIAHSALGPEHAPLKAEAMRLLLLWRETMIDAPETADHKEQRMMLLAGLRKRTIQVLVRLRLEGLLFIP